MISDDMGDLRAFVSVVRAGGFREAARITGSSASGLSAAVRRLEAGLGLRLLHRTTRSLRPTEQGQSLFERTEAALLAVADALTAARDAGDRPSGSLKLNVPVNVARHVLPALLAGFLERYPGIRVEVVADSRPVDVLAAGCDAGIRYDERLEQDMIAVPIGARHQRFATAAAPAFLDRHGRPAHPGDLSGMPCLLARFSGGELEPWEFERDGEVIRIRPAGPLVANVGVASDLLAEAAVRGLGFVHTFEESLAPFFRAGTLEPVLPDWWQVFPGPRVYYFSQRLVPPPLRAFIDYVKTARP